MHALQEIDSQIMLTVQCKKSCRPVGACGELNPPGKRFCADCGARLPIVCPSCTARWPGTSRFCGDCGTRLPGWCPSCGAEVMVSRAFCGNCGASLLAPAGDQDFGVHTHAFVGDTSTSDDERRLVTALFCDLVGFTPLNELLDAEEVRELQTAYFDLMSREIVQYGGVVEKFAGDAVLALFGVPVAHEHDAERAVRCALAMHTALIPLATDCAQRCGVSLGIRVGVNTGEAVSGTLESAEAKGHTIVTGDVVNTAARLQSAAEPGEIMVGTQTMRLAQRTVEFGERQALTLKSKAGTVPAYPVRGLRERPIERWETEQQRTPLVGRERELNQMLQAWSRTRQGVGQLLMLVAEAGIGKSRLLGRDR